MRRDVVLGPLTRAMCEGARWAGRDQFPAWQEWADECERLLSFLDAKGKLEEYLKRLRGELNQRIGAYSEVRVAYWFERNGFKITHWDPKATENPGDLEVQWQSLPPIFVEIKTRTWFAELSKEDKAAGRDKEPRYKNLEVRSYDADRQVIGAMGKAKKKFAEDRPNLLVVGESMFRSPVDDADPGLISRSLVDPEFGPIGAVMCIDAVSWSDHRGFQYRTLFIENPRASGLPWAIPPPVAEGLRNGNTENR